MEKLPQAVALQKKYSQYKEWAECLREVKCNITVDFLSYDGEPFSKLEFRVPSKEENPQYYIRESLCHWADFLDKKSQKIMEKYNELDQE